MADDQDTLVNALRELDSQQELSDPELIRLAQALLTMGAAALWARPQIF